MTDRLTQLQDAVNQQAENFCNAIGILQQSSPPTKFPPERGGTANATPPSSMPDNQNYSLMFATLIARTAKDIDHLIESLPSEESSHELQLASLRRLEQENVDAAQKLKEIIDRGEKLLEKLQLALSDISKSQMDMQRTKFISID